MTDMPVLIRLIPLLMLLFTPTLQASERPDFRQFPAGEARKEAFLNYMSPLVEQENQAILKQRALIESVRPRTDADGSLISRQWRKVKWWWHRDTVETIARLYGQETFDPANEDDWHELLTRVDIVPNSLVLAQAANESAWGTSRFAREGNNYFGQWCFVKGCGLVPKRRGSGQQQEVQKFDSPADSVRSYLMNINTHRAYKALREVRARHRHQGELADGMQLASTLTNYSERGEDYVKELRAMIHHNDLERFDMSDVET